MKTITKMNKRPSQKSLNLTLFEAFLEEMKMKSLFERISHISLRHIMAYSQAEPLFDSSTDSLDLINLVKRIQNKEILKSVSHFAKDDLKLLNSLRYLKKELNDDENYALSEAIFSVEKYYES